MLRQAAILALLTLPLLLAVTPSAAATYCTSSVQVHCMHCNDRPADPDTCQDWEYCPVYTYALGCTNGVRGGIPIDPTKVRQIVDNVIHTLP